MLYDGEPLEAAERLRSLLSAPSDQPGAGGAVGAERPRVAAVRVVDPASGVDKGHFGIGEAMAIECDVAGAAGVPPVSVRLAVTGPHDVPIWVMDSEPLAFGRKGMATVRFTVKELPPIRGIFKFAVAVRDPATKVAYDARRFGEAFLAVGDSDRGVVDAAWSAEQVDVEEGQP